MTSFKHNNITFCHIAKPHLFAYSHIRQHSKTAYSSLHLQTQAKATVSNGNDFYETFTHPNGSLSRFNFAFQYVFSKFVA